MIKKLLQNFLGWIMDIPSNEYHPLVWLVGCPSIGSDVYIGGFTEINANGAYICIGHNCDIASFVVINCADSHKRTVGVAQTVERKSIEIGPHVFIGTHTVILGGTYIGHHSVVGAGVVLKGEQIPPFSLVYRGQSEKVVIRKGYYVKEL